MGKLDKLADKVDPYRRHIKRPAGDASTREFVERVKATAKPDPDRDDR